MFLMRNQGRKIQEHFVLLTQLPTKGIALRAEKSNVDEEDLLEGLLPMFVFE